MDEAVYVDDKHWIYVECDDIMLNHYLQLNVTCDFTYATNGIFVVCVGYNLFLITNYSHNWNFYSSGYIP
jgi:hypothetical protein